jgi:hypothetical protein
MLKIELLRKDVQRAVPVRLRDYHVLYRALDTRRGWRCGFSGSRASTVYERAVHPGLAKAIVLSYRDQKPVGGFIFTSRTRRSYSPTTCLVPLRLFLI